MGNILPFQIKYLNHRVFSTESGGGNKKRKKKINLLKKGSSKKISYERGAYESVDDKSHSQVLSQKATKNKTRALMG